MTTQSTEDDAIAFQEQESVYADLHNAELVYHATVQTEQAPPVNESSVQVTFGYCKVFVFVSVVILS